MSIKPIDLQVMVPRVSEISRIHSGEQQRNQASQQQQTSAIHNMADNSIKQVYSRNEAQEAAIKAKQEKQEKQKEKEEQNRDKQKQPKSKYTKGKEMQINTIDIRI